MSMNNNIPLGVSDFYSENSRPEKGNSYTILQPGELVELVWENWHNRLPGLNEPNLDRKVVVPVPASLPVERFGYPSETPLFRTCFVRLDPRMNLKARVMQRQKGEDYYVQTYLPASEAMKAGWLPEPANFVKVVCYHKEALLENNGSRSTDKDWEVVTILASASEHEPMTALTMMRNQMQRVGGTFTEYTPQQWAEAVLYWSQRIRIMPE